MTRSIPCPSDTPTLSPPDGYYLHKVIDVALTSDEQVTITVENPRGLQVTFCVHWLVADESFGDAGDAFDASRIWVGGPTTLRRAEGAPPRGADMLLVAKAFIEDTPFAAVADWISGIKWPTAAGEA